MPNVNSVATNLIVKVGSRYEEPDEEGISLFLEHMAFKGTTTRTAKQIFEEFDSIGGQFNAYTAGGGMNKLFIMPEQYKNISIRR